MVRFRQGFTRKRVSGQLVWPVMWAGITLAGLWLTPSAQGHGTHMQLGLPPCPSVLLWDRPCPGCGLTTSISAALHGDFALAWHSHPFGPMLYALLTLGAIAGFFGWIKKLRVDCSSKAFYWSACLFVLAYLVHGTVRFVIAPPLDDPYSLGQRIQRDAAAHRS